MTPTLRLATFDDAQDLWEWANDAVTRQNALNSEDIPWESHLTWLHDVLANNKQTLFVAEYLETPMASCRFDSTPDGAVVTIALAPSHRGMKLSLPVLRIAIEHYWAEKGLCPILAYIRPHNTPSIRLFKACDFESIESDVDDANRFVLNPK